MKPIYLDYNATTPIDPAVVAAMEPDSAPTPKSSVRVTCS
jgi:cysteine sulfinate desulfinase/cysteine desulfurase-like protein